MKKNKKILLTLGTVATVIAPIATVVSCGSSTGAAKLSDGAVTVKLQNYVNGSDVTAFVPTDSTTWYTPIISDRVHDEANNGITPFGLFAGVNQKAYDFGTLENSIAYNLGYLQNGKLLMISQYTAHPITETTDIRSSLSQLGTVLNKTFKSYAAKKIAEFETDANANGAGNTDVAKIKNVLENYKVEDVIESSAKNLSELDYKGLHGLATTFSQNKYLNAAEGSQEQALGDATMKYINGALNQFSWDLHEHVEKQTVAENTRLFYAYDEVMGYSWDAYTGVLGDRQSPSPSLVKPRVKLPAPVDHNDLLGNWVIESGDRNLKELEPSTNSVGQYAGQLFRYAGSTFIPDSAVYSAYGNETLGLGIIPYDKGAPVYDSTGQIVAGEVSQRLYKFGLFDSITITTKGDVTTKFDSDDDDDTNAKSINGQAFKDAIAAGAKKIVVHVKGGQKYVSGGTGDETSEEVKAEDFWTGIQNEVYSTVGVRNKVSTFGGTQLAPEEDGDQPRNSIAKKFEDAIEKSTTNKTAAWAAPSKTEATTKPYFWDLAGTTYGMDPFVDTTARHDQIVDDAAGTLTFDFHNDSEVSATTLFWNQMFANPADTNLKAMPTEFVKAQATKFIDKINLTDAEKADLITKPGIKYGTYYDYAADKLEDFRYAGRYIPKIGNKEQSVWTKNTHYNTASWPNHDTAPESLTVEYIDQSGAYGTQYKDQYDSGKIYTAPIKDPKLKGWSDEISQKSDADKKAYGLMYVKAATSKGDVGERFQTLALPFGTKNSEQAKYYFGDNFAKVLYGETIEDLWADTTLEKLAESLYQGTGLEFRSSLQAGINPFALAHNMSDGLMGAMSTYGPEAQIPGTDVNTADPETVYSSEIFNRAAFGKNFIEISDTKYREQATAAEGSSENHVSGTLLTQIKENIADALSKAGVTGNVVSELPIDYLSGLNSIDTATSLQNYLVALNSLNTQLHFAANTNPAQVLKK